MQNITELFDASMTIIPAILTKPHIRQPAKHSTDPIRQMKEHQLKHSHTAGFMESTTENLTTKHFSCIFCSFIITYIYFTCTNVSMQMPFIPIAETVNDCWCQSVNPAAESPLDSQSSLKSVCMSGWWMAAHTKLSSYCFLTLAVMLYWVSLERGQCQPKAERDTLDTKKYQHDT